ncbi:hypothetical protein [Psychrobacter sp. HII-4]|uniref:hypothetical protein n=1 Tax=Psychrobacter sp. HII-4 TaxID=1569264 RepID=UPI001918D9FD|nr:hypothetical protein [Psychrobacter sp. HII-4]
MKKFALVCVSIPLLLAACQSTVMPIPKPTPNSTLEQTVSQTLIIMYNPSIGKQALLKAVADHQATIVYDYKILNGMAIRLPAGTDMNQAIKDFRQVQGVVSVEKDTIQTILQ